MLCGGGHRGRKYSLDWWLLFFQSRFDHSLFTYPHELAFPVSPPSALLFFKVSSLRIGIGVRTAQGSNIDLHLLLASLHLPDSSSAIIFFLYPVALCWHYLGPTEALRWAVTQNSVEEGRKYNKILLPQLVLCLAFYSNLPFPKHILEQNPFLSSWFLLFINPLLTPVAFLRWILKGGQLPMLVCHLVLCTDVLCHLSLTKICNICESIATLSSLFHLCIICLCAIWRF